jgi:YVTN family beta-propeller protein
MDLDTRARRATDEMLRIPRDLDAGLVGLYRTRRRRAVGKAATAAVAMVLVVAGVLVARNHGGQPPPPPTGPTQVITIAHGNPSGDGYGFGSVWVTVFASNKGSGPAHPATPKGGYVDRYDPATRTLEKRITVGSDPLAAEHGFGSMWVTNAGDGGTVTRIDPATNTVLATIPVGPFPYQIAAAGGGMWVATQKAAVKIDPTTDAIVARAPYPRPPHTTVATTAGVALDANAQGVWVSTAYGTVLRLRPFDGRLLATIPVQKVPNSQPGEVVIHGNDVWTSNYPIKKTRGPGAASEKYGPVNHLTEIDATTGKIIRRVPTGGYPVESLLPENRTLLIAGYDQNNNTVLVRTDWPYQVVSYARPIRGSCFDPVDTHGHVWIPCFTTRKLHVLPDADFGLPNSP